VREPILCQECSASPVEVSSKVVWRSGWCRQACSNVMARQEMVGKERGATVCCTVLETVWWCVFAWLVHMNLVAKAVCEVRGSTLC
jgi:hypothetical protein